MSDVVCLGIFVADALGRPIDTIPEKARLQLFDRMELHTGGCAVNTGIAMAKLGTDVGVIGKVGDDGFGDFLIKELQSAGVDTRGVVRDKEASTSFTFIMIASDGERRFLHTMGANATFCIDDVNMDIVKEAKLLHVAGSYLMSTFDGAQTAEVLRQAKEAGVTTSLDTAYNDRLDDWLGVIKPSFPYIDYFVPSIEEAERISGKKTPKDIAEFFRDNGCRNVGLKLGREGCYVRTGDVEVKVPIYKVETIDSSGAGDCWIAGFLTGVINGWDVEKAAKFGNAAAAHCVQAIGCTAGVKTLEEVLEFQKKNNGSVSF
ncbi:MAG: sugar kinase [Planctomycetes bacterium]|nr:sugar kinase [Planctomycetota bacterium]